MRSGQKTPGCFYFALAWETEIALPPNSFWWRFFMASSASVSLSISTKPNPRLFPVVRSMITLAELTCPNGSNKFFSSSLLTLKFRLETYKFIKKILQNKMGNTYSSKRKEKRTVSVAKKEDRYLSRLNVDVLLFLCWMKIPFYRTLAK